MKAAIEHWDITPVLVRGPTVVRRSAAPEANSVSNKLRDRRVKHPLRTSGQGVLRRLRVVNRARLFSETRNQSRHSRKDWVGQTDNFRKYRTGPGLKVFILAGRAESYISNIPSLFCACYGQSASWNISN
jgi:hypothetical protein